MNVIDVLEELNKELEDHLKESEDNSIWDDHYTCIRCYELHELINKIKKN